MKSAKKPSARAVPFITVGDKKYVGDRVPDGLYDSVSSLKKENTAALCASPMYESWSQDYAYILQLCRNKRDVPLLSLAQSTNILFRMKPNVRDIWTISPLHFRNAGDEGAIHFNFVLNQVIQEINSSSVKELNTVHALLLHKGREKPRTSERSYRTISTCPVVAKALDMHIHDLFVDDWNEAQADTQYQGENSSHELASLLVTETIQHSLFFMKKPLFLLLLDARSAFDTVVIKFLIRNLFFTGMTGNSLMYMNNRLTNRLTYCSWEREMMGPIHDEHGLEQGGCNSSDAYKIYNNELLESVQNSAQGVDIGRNIDTGNNIIISGIGQADDVALVANNIHNIFNILHLTLNYCRKYQVELCAEKTRLLHFPASSSPEIFYNPIKINQQQITFSAQAEHVGVIRSPSAGNVPHLLNRFAAHKRALGSVLFSGAARGHRGNLAAVMKIEKLYAVPVLLSGTASLVLSKSEENMIDQHYICTLRNLLKVCKSTPRSFVLFMCGSLPASALLNLRQLSLFSMVCRLPNDPLYARAVYSLTVAKPSSRSWFKKIRDTCHMYGLPHPLILLRNPLPKETFKKMIKSHVMNYWEETLRAEASLLPSLNLFNPYFHSLASPHPLLTTPGSNPYEVSKAIVQCKMNSGRYQTSLLTRHWSPSNPNGYCLAPSCSETPESLEHLLLHCPYYSDTRGRLIDLWTRPPINSVVLPLIISLLTGSPQQLLGFILDPSTHNQVILLCQNNGRTLHNTFFHLTRSWCSAIHVERLKLLRKWTS